MMDMVSVRPLSQPRAIRALAEGARPTLELLADASRRSLDRLRSTAAREGWDLDRAPPEDFHLRIRPIVAKLLDQIEGVSKKAAEEGGKIDRTEIDGLLAMVRVLDKISEFARPEEAARQKQIRDDEDLAAVLERLNARIIELARALAGQMVAQRDRARGA